MSMWTPWAGGLCPVPKHTIVKVKRRDGYVFPAHQAAAWDWQHVHGQHDIVAYCIIYLDEKE